jgi:glycosyltransferase involved in cell wall biosynthesis
VEHIIEAARLLRDDHHLENFRVKLIGNVFPNDAGYAEGLRQQVTSSGLDSIVEFAGPVLFEDIVTEYQQADVMVNMSATGSADKVVLEAMSCGVPVISANDAYKVILSDWADTLLTPPDDPSMLARRISNLASMPVSERSRLGAKVREVVVKDHSLNRLMHRLLNDLLDND